MKTLPLSLAIATAISGSMITHTVSAEQPAEAIALDVVTVSADFRDSNVQELPEAVTVIGADDITARSAQHLESVLSFAPNVNFSSGASRGRYFQIRGIGERSQFVDPVNPSVGLMIDGIDMTGLGGAATLFDVEQVEVLRGPQGTRFGANALAGMINIKSNDATKETEGYVAAKVGNYNTHSESAAISGSVSDNVQGRLAINSFQSDGYMENEFSDKDNTNNLDEVVVRGKLAAQVSENTNLGLTYFYADIDNGYDAFSLDNNRTTYSDEPGIDAQETHAFALNLDSKLSNAVMLETVLTTAKSDVEYRYDVDWAYGQYDDNTGSCVVAQGPCLETEAGAWGYSYADQYLRNYQRNSIDIRFLSADNGRIFANSTDWVVGIYHQTRNEELTRNYTPDPKYTSELDVTSTSIYTELTTDLSVQSRIIYGVRVEQWRNDFENSLMTNSDETETLFGGQVTFERLLNNDHLAYASLARGYKAGGANSATVVSEDKRTFDTEYNNTLEVGLKSSMLNDGLVTRIAAFYIQRKNQQVKQSFVTQDVGDAPDFTDFIANAAEGINQGLEIESQWQLLDQLRWDVSFGYLKAEFTDYKISAQDDDDTSKLIDKKGRAQAHAPEYSLATGLSFSATQALTLSVESEAKDTFYFSDSHDGQSKEYVLWHARIAYDQGPFAAAVFGRNLTNKDQEVRGFGGFGNDPRDGYVENRYIQFGEPRTFGVEARYSF
ncbi:MAG: iron complex outermembrane receptor protein [Oleispira sp.]|jgi:iron complex outermembrane receptor protein